MATIPLAFVDTEAISLARDIHTIWEVGLVLRRPDYEDLDASWVLPVNLGLADPLSLKISQYHERAGWASRASLAAFADEFAELTRGAHLVGAVPSFDEERLYRLLRDNGACPEWHYHLVDVESLVAGHLKVEPPWDSNVLSRAMGVRPEAYARHTALGDAQWARDLYDAVFAIPPPGTRKRVAATPSYLTPSPDENRFDNEFP